MAPTCAEDTCSWQFGHSRSHLQTCSARGWSRGLTESIGDVLSAGDGRVRCSWKDGSVPKPTP